MPAAPQPLEQGRGWWALFGAVAVGLLALPQFTNSYNTTLLIVYALLALSLGLVWGIGGILCFGQGAFFGLGAYAYAISAINFQAHAWGTPVALLLAIAVPGLFAALLGAMMFYGRISDVYLGVITLVVTLVFFKYLNAASGPGDVIGSAPLGGFNGIPNYPLPALGDPAAPWIDLSGDALYYLCAGCLLIAWLAARQFMRGSLGRILQGIRENEMRAQLLGYDVRRFKTGLFAAGGALAGLAGMLYASWAEIVTPGLFSLGQSAEVIIWVIVGGLGTLAGPMVGAVLLGIVKTLLASQSAINNQLVMGAILLAAVLAFPQGIVPWLTRRLHGLWTRLQRRPAVPADSEEAKYGDA
jgi:branched-chain amino acid transport system permease protein